MSRQLGSSKPGFSGHTPATVVTFHCHVRLLSTVSESILAGIKPSNRAEPNAAQDQIRPEGWTQLSWFRALSWVSNPWKPAQRSCARPVQYKHPMPINSLRAGPKWCQGTLTCATTITVAEMPPDTRKLSWSSAPRPKIGLYSKRQSLLDTVIESRPRQHCAAVLIN